MPITNHLSATLLALSSLVTISQPAHAEQAQMEPCKTLDCLRKEVAKRAKAALAKNQFVGMSVVVVKREDDGSFSSFKSHFGYRDAKNKLVPTDATLYELGSITKPVTFLTLAVQDKIKLTDPIGPYLPKGVRNPKPNGKEIRFEHLLSHTAEIPKRPCIVLADGSNKCFGEPRPRGNRYKNLTEQEFYKFVDASAQMYLDFPTFFAKPGDYKEYSSMGTALLGELVARTHGMSYEDYVHHKILEPLKMTESFLSLPCTSRPNCDQLAKVYERDNPEQDWRQTQWRTAPFAKGTGRLKSSANDMVKFLKANLAPETTPIAKGLERSHSLLVDVTATRNSNICKKDEKPSEDRCNRRKKGLYWSWIKDRRSPVLWHNGATTGSQAMLAFTMDGKLGIAVLENSLDSDKMYHPDDFAYCILEVAGSIPKANWCERFDG